MGGSDHIMLDLEEWSLVLNKMLRWVEMNLVSMSGTLIVIVKNSWQRVKISLLRKTFFQLKIKNGSLKK